MAFCKETPLLMREPALAFHKVVFMKNCLSCARRSCLREILSGASVFERVNIISNNQGFRKNIRTKKNR